MPAELDEVKVEEATITNALTANTIASESQSSDRISETSIATAVHDRGSTTNAFERSPAPVRVRGALRTSSAAANSQEALQADTSCAKFSAAISIVVYLLLWLLFANVFGGRGWLMPFVYSPVLAYAWWVRSKRRKHEALGQSNVLPSNVQLLLLVGGGFSIGSICTIILETVILTAFGVMFGSILRIMSPILQLLFAFFFLSYMVAAFVEEHMKYAFAHSHNWRRTFVASIDGILMYSMAAALGFSIVENIMYVYTPSISSVPAPNNDGDAVHTITEITWPFLIQLLTRVCIATPLHVTTAYFIGLGIARRDVLGESLKRMSILSFPMLLHGTFNFHQFVLAVLIFTPGELRQQLGWDLDSTTSDSSTSPTPDSSQSLTKQEIIFQVVTLCTTSIILAASVWYARKKRHALDGGGYQVVDDEPSVELQAI